MVLRPWAQTHALAVVLLVVVAGAVAQRPAPVINHVKAHLQGYADGKKQEMFVVFDSINGHTLQDYVSYEREGPFHVYVWNDHALDRCYKALVMNDNWQCSQEHSPDVPTSMLPADCKWLRTDHCLEGSLSKGKRCDVFSSETTASVFPTATVMSANNAGEFYLEVDSSMFSGLRVDDLELAVVEYDTEHTDMPPVPKPCLR